MLNKIKHSTKTEVQLQLLRTVHWAKVYTAAKDCSHCLP